MLAVVFDVRLRPRDVGDLFLRARRNGLVDLELGDGRLIGARNLLLGGVLVIGRHGESFGQEHPQHMPISPMGSRDIAVETSAAQGGLAFTDKRHSALAISRSACDFAFNGRELFRVRGESGFG